MLLRQAYMQPVWRNLNFIHPKSKGDQKAGGGGVPWTETGTSQWHLLPSYCCDIGFAGRPNDDALMLYVAKLCENPPGPGGGSVAPAVLV